MVELPKGVIISCQLEPGDPIEDPTFVLNLAKAAKYAGAVGIRTNGPLHVKLIKENLGMPVIGLVKDRRYEAYITPTIEDAFSLAQVGADFIAIDCTRRRRPVELERLFEMIRKEFPNVGIVADIADLQDALNVSRFSPDYIATTLSGYTTYTSEEKLPNIQLVRELTSKIDIPVIAEGGYSTPEEVQKAFENGAHAVVIGTAISRPWIVIGTYVNAFQKALFNLKKE